MVDSNYILVLVFEPILHNYVLFEFKSSVDCVQNIGVDQNVTLMY